VTILNGGITIEFESNDNILNANFGEIQLIKDIDVEYYMGKYVVTPKVEAQMMETSGKMMSDNVTIKEIPFFETSNVSGGKTVYIGREIE
jgi:hypothetical protein